MSQVKDPAKEFEKLFQQRLRDTPFDVKDYPTFSRIVDEVYHNLPLSAIGCDWPTMKEILEISDGRMEPSLYHVSFVFNGMERVSPKLAGIESFHYIDLMDYVHERGTVWNEQVGPIKNSVMRKMQSDADLKGRIVHPNKGLIGHKN